MKIILVQATVQSRTADHHSSGRIFLQILAVILGFSFAILPRKQAVLS